MAWKGRVEEQIGFIDLLSVLVNSKIQQGNPPLYQVISLLLKRLGQNKDLVVEALEELQAQTQIIGDTIINITGSLQDATYLTTADETLKFPSSVQLLAGAEIIFDDSVPNQRTIESSAGVSLCFIPMVNGDEPPQLLSNGVGDLILIGYTI